MYGDAANVNFATYMSVCAPISLCAVILTWLFMTFLYAPGYVAQLWRKRIVTDRQTTHEATLIKTWQIQHKELGPIRLVGAILCMEKNKIPFKSQRHFTF